MAHLTMEFASSVLLNYREAYKQTFKEEFPKDDETLLKIVNELETMPTSKLHDLATIEDMYWEVYKKYPEPRLVLDDEF